MTKDEALRLAFEAFESIFLSTHPYREDGTCTINDKSVELSNKAIIAIKAALEAKDEPVALAWTKGYQMGISDERTSEANIGIAGFNAKVEPARENPYITAPPQRTWVGLTKEDLKPLCDEWRIVYGAWAEDFAQAIEAKLKEKNT